MPWFGLSINDSDECSTEEDELLNDLESGRSLPPISTESLEAVPAANPSSNASSSSSGSDELAAILTPSADALEDSEPLRDRICYRQLRPGDRSRIQQLHEQWFPVTYSDEFYDELVTNQRLATSGDHLFTCVATLDTQNMYCQPAGQDSLQQDDDETIGCVVGAFLHHSRLNPETAALLVPNPQVHSKLFYIMTLGTVEQFRNYGVATSLVEQTMDLVEHDPTCGALYLHVIPFNHAAIRFYEKLGFYRVCTIDNYYSIDDKQYDCYLYAKYFNGNRGHRTLYKLVSGAISSIWQHLRAPLSIFSSSTSEE